MAEPDAQERAALALRDSILAGHLEKHAMEQRAVEAALSGEQSRLEAHRTAHADAHGAHERVHGVTEHSHREQHIAEQRAVTAAVTAMDRRLEGMNEFRDALRDQATSFARKDALDALDSQFERRYEELRTMVQTEKEERRATEGVKRGMNATTAIIVAAIGVVGTVLGIVIVISNLLTP